MRLSKRIYAIKDAVPEGNTAADIGTDHGYVPMLLIKEGISPRVIMSDISESSLSKAKETFRLCGLPADEEDFRVGDGLCTIEKGEVDSVIIAGLGAHTIIDILDNDIDKSKSYGRLILQPRKHSGALRHYLYTHGWDITEEKLAGEGKFECEIISAVPGSEESRNEPYPADDIRWKYPKEIVTADREAASRRIGWKIKSIEEQIDNLRKSRKDNDERIALLEKDREYLIELLK